MTTQESLELEQLSESYEIIGELAGRDDARTFIAKRREDGKDVLIAVAQTPPGDEGNALSHLATDAKRLVELSHRNLLPVLEGRWIGTDAFAVVTPRVYFPTLEELLSRRDEEFSFPRVATILQEINGALEWARTQKVVHRAIALDTVFVEPGSDRVLVSFAIRPLSRADMPGADDDAKTIATLASAMLTRSPADSERARMPLADARPGLPGRLIEQTEALLQLTGGNDSRTPDVNGYIGVIAMADTLKRSETECAESTRKLLNEERVAREQIEAERQATERAAAEQARLFQNEREEFTRESQSEREQLARASQNERDEFAREREKILRELTKERENLARERAALARERAEHAEDRATLMAEREEHKRWAQEVEVTIDSQGAALKEQAAQFAALREAQASVAVETATATDDQPFALPPRRRSKRVRPEWQRALSRQWDNRPHWKWDNRPHWNQRWNFPAAAFALLLLLGVSAVAVTRGRGATALVAGARILDSVAGGVAPAMSTVGGGVPADLIAGVVARSDSLAGGVAPTRSPAISTAGGGVPTDLIAGIVARSDSLAAAAERTIRRQRAAAALARPVPPDSVVRRDTIAAPRPDGHP